MEGPFAIAFKYINIPSVPSPPLGNSALACEFPGGGHKVVYPKTVIAILCVEVKDWKHKCSSMVDYSYTVEYLVADKKERVLPSSR